MSVAYACPSTRVTPKRTAFLRMVAISRARVRWHWTRQRETVSSHRHLLMTMRGRAVPSSTIVEERFAPMIRHTPSRAMPHRQQRSNPPTQRCFTASIPRAHATARAARLTLESLTGTLRIALQRRRCEGMLDGAPRSSPVEDGSRQSYVVSSPTVLGLSGSAPASPSVRDA
jgi:hypothetical protein